MSLRDQLMAKGLVSKKRARSIDRELKQDRKKKQSQRRKKKQVEREQQAAAEAAQEAERARRAALRRAAEEAEAAARLATRIRTIVLGNRVHSRGKQAYRFRAVDGRTVLRMHISERVAWKLRAGEAAIAAMERTLGGDLDYHVISAGAARELLDLAPRRVVHFVQDTEGISAPEERFLEPDWEISLVPHRVGGPGSAPTDARSRSRG